MEVFEPIGQVIRRTNEVGKERVPFHRRKGGGLVEEFTKEPSSALGDPLRSGRGTEDSICDTAVGGEPPLVGSLFLRMLTDANFGGHTAKAVKGEDKAFRRAFALPVA